MRDLHITDPCSHRIQNIVASCQDNLTAYQDRVVVAALAPVPQLKLGPFHNHRHQRIAPFGCAAVQCETKSVRPVLEGWSASRGEGGLVVEVQIQYSFVVPSGHGPCSQ